jgi:branched-chain amino acid transport system substrate-binding protein
VSKKWWCIPLAAIGAALVVSLTASAAPNGKAAGQPIIVGYSIAKTGGFSTYDGELETGGKIAAQAINAKGGVLGRQIKIIDCDTKTELAQSGPCAEQLISKGATVIIGTSDYDFGGGANQGSNAEGAVEAELAHNKGWTKPYILTDTINSYPKTVTTSFITRWKELTGSNVAGQDLFLNSDASIATQISRLRSANPDVIIISSFPPGGASAIKQIRAAGINTPIVTDEAFDGSSWISAVPNLSNTYTPNLASGDGNDPSPLVNKFFVDFKKFSGQKAVLAAYPVMGYSQIQVMAKGMEDAKSTDGNKVAAALEKLHNFPALIGPTSFDWRHQCNVAGNRPFLIFKITNGKKQFVQRLLPKSVPPFKC